LETVSARELDSSPTLEDQSDANGKPMHDEFLKVVREKGSGWVDYVFPKPGESKPSRKWTYVKGLDIDATPGLIGAGFYPE
jgi:cytochrome c